jgi:hypothetical protein
MNDDNRFGQVLVTLLQGVLYRDSDASLWQSLFELQARVRDYCATIGLELLLDEAEGYAYLRQRLTEFDATGGDTRLVISRDQVADQVRLFLPDTANEARLLDRIDAYLNKVIELGFLRRLRGQDDHFEVRRILKAFVDAQWLAEFEQRLAAYATHAEEEAP